jgi:hypothetical protein
MIMQFLTDLGISHTSATGPNGTMVTFGHVFTAERARTLLVGAGFQVAELAPRALLIAPVPVRKWRERHPVAYRWLFWSTMVLIFPAFYVSVPVYAVMLWRWYVRRNGHAPLKRPGNGRRRAPQGYCAGSPNIPNGRRPW